MLAGFRVLESQKRDDLSQPAQSRGLRDVKLKARSQSGPPVLGRGQSRERRRRHVAPLVGRKLPDLANEPIAVLFGH